MEEYRTLRSEILTYLQIIAQIYVFLVAASGALLGYAVTATAEEDQIRQLSFLSPLVVAIPGLYMIIARLDSIYGIGAYIRIRIEPRIPGLGWETAWGDLNVVEGFEHRFDIKTIGTSNAAILTFVGIEGLSALLFALQWTGAVWIAGIAGGLVLTHAVHAIVLGRAATDQSRHARRWLPSSNADKPKTTEVEVPAPPSASNHEDAV